MTDALRSDLGVALAPRTAAVVGATDRRAGLQLWLSLSVGAETVAVHRSGRAADGARVVARAEDLPFAPDVCALAVGPGAIVAAAREAIAAGARLLVVPGLGPEDGEPGATARAELGELCTASSVPLVGPNCMGVAVPGGASAWLGTVPHGDLRPGGVAVRRALGIAWRGAAARRPALRPARRRLERQRGRTRRGRLARDPGGGRPDDGHRPGTRGDPETRGVRRRARARRERRQARDRARERSLAGRRPCGARALGRGRRLGAGGGGAVRGTRGDHRGRRAGLARAPRGVRSRPATPR